jgi:hypothetical protein
VTKMTVAERMAVIETDMQYLKKGQDEQKVCLGEIKDLLREHIKQADEKFERLDDKYASKLIERVVYGMIGLIVAAVIGAILKLVIL